ncbi:RseA family anti-sigma factor [Thermomonas sp.]|uniref:sigma-E factor negative regulatory protein n=1 Tax=Thermomonas sp. TaxID=1971895 RepID=UPI003D1003A9
METTPDTDRHCIGLTQLSSREQLSALMDGMLPEDQTRFLLRRLQHDAELAGSWERWRIASDVMRGLAPARHLPADFALRVAAALQGPGLAVDAAPARARRWYWGGGAALAAALVLLAVVRWPQPVDTPESSAPAAAPSLAAATPVPSAPVPRAPAAVAPTVASVTPAVEQATPRAPAVAAAGLALAAAAGTQATRRERAHPLQVAAPASAPPVIELAQALPAAPADAAGSRPWPRRILPQYGGDSGLTVGFGEHMQAAPAPFNPFPALPPPSFLQPAQTPPQAEPAQP